MKLRFAAAATVAGLAGVIGLSAPAQAADADVQVAQPSAVSALADYTLCATIYTNGTAAGKGCFSSYGDKFTLDDYKADGLRVVVEWYTDYGRSGECHWTGGADGGQGVCNYDMREDGRVNFRVAVRNGSTAANTAATSWSGYVPIGG
ncbi:hypothetical protein ACFV9D_18635 [Streptomyces sp. NPDC059875]|uniref:hypothetical protein n=1 Tax=unclassified Streptomyces TaxID=2593676 RepID=UPI00365A5C1F